MLVLDVETAAQARALAVPFPRENEVFVEKEHGSLKDPAKIAEWKAKQRSNWETEIAAERDAWKGTCASNGALSRLDGRIVAVGILHSTIDGSEPMPVVACKVDESRERDLVKFAIDALAHNERTARDRVVTFNGHGFDFPLLFVRAAVLGVEIPSEIDIDAFLRRYNKRPHTDLRMVLSNWDMRFEGTLNGWCAAFGIQNEDESTGADIGRMVEAGDEDGIIAHCKHDLVKVLKLAERLEAARLI